MGESTQDLTPLGELIEQHLDNLRWSQRKLSTESGVDQASISRLMRGLQAPTHEVVEKLAAGLRVDVVRMKEAAGLRVELPPVDRDQFAEYASQELNRLLSDPDTPEWIKEAARDAVGAAIDTHRKIADQLKLEAARQNAIEVLEQGHAERRRRAKQARAQEQESPREQARRAILEGRQDLGEKE